MTRAAQLAVATLVLAFAYLIQANPQRQGRQADRPFVDSFQDIFPEDDNKFYFNYTYGDESKRVYFRSSSPDTRNNFNNNRVNNRDRNRNRRPVYVADIADDDYERNQPNRDNGYGGYGYERPSVNGLTYDRQNVQNILNDDRLNGLGYGGQNGINSDRQNGLNYDRQNGQNRQNNNQRTRVPARVQVDLFKNY